MIGGFRVLWKLPAVVAVTMIAYVSVGISRPFRRWLGARQVRFRNRMFTWWGHAFLRVVGARLHVEGPRPRGAFYLVTNHLGYLDIVVLAALVDAAFVAKKELRHWPVIGLGIALFDTIFVDRSRRRDVLRVLDAMSGSLHDEMGVIVFPEATSASGDEMLPFKPSLLDFAARRELPVHYATISYRTPEGSPPARESVCWWGDMPFGPHVFEFLSLPGLEVRVRFGDEPVHDPDRKVLAETLRERMERIFEPCR